MNEYGFFTHEAGSYQERVHHIQLAYASYAALLALFEITSLLGVEGLNLSPVCYRGFNCAQCRRSHAYTSRIEPRTSVSVACEAKEWIPAHVLKHWVAPKGSLRRCCGLPSQVNETRWDTKQKFFPVPELCPLRSNSGPFSPTQAKLQSTIYKCGRARKIALFQIKRAMLYK
jgi:hypothetical protein